MKTGKSAGALLALYTTRPDYIAAVYKKDLCRWDFLRKTTLRYAKALEKAGHPSLLLDYADAGKLPHAFVTLYPSSAEGRDAIQRIHEMLISS